MTAELRLPFPAVTVPAQTTPGTGQSPATHGDAANGKYDRDNHEAAFWERDRGDRNRLWEAASDDAGLTTGALFFQHLIRSSADVAVTPSPIEDEDNNMVEMDCWANPDGFYNDLEESQAFAMVDHQVAHIYTNEPGEARTPLETLDAILTEADRSVCDLDHPNSGDLVLIASSDAWFQYYWWHDGAAAPDYATDMDIHAKPG